MELSKINFSEKRHIDEAIIKREMYCHFDDHSWKYLSLRIALTPIDLSISNSVSLDNLNVTGVIIDLL